MKSAPGKGATFVIDLPRAINAITETPPIKAVPVRGGTETILLAEDETGIRTLFTAFLTRLGYTVLPAVDGVEALQLALDHKSKIHLLISDVVMPNRGGRELAERLASRFPEIKIIMMSGYAGGDTAISAIKQVGVLLQKPLSANELARKVREVLDRVPEVEAD